MSIEMNAKERSKEKDEKSAKDAELARASGGLGYDWMAVLLCAWLIGGGYADAWAHNHLPIDNFFTPWHATLYSGVLVIAIFTIGTFVRNLRRGYPARLAMPAGYGLSLFGVVFAAFSGLGDMIWHILFGIELGINGALSPTHIAASISMTLIVAGPLRASWQRGGAENKSSLAALFPMLLSLTFTLSMFTVLSQIVHPFVNTWPSSPVQTFDDQALAVASIVLQTLILMSFVLVLIRRWTVPFGSFTVIMSLNVILLSFMQDHYQMIFVGLLAGLTADLLYWRLRPSLRRPEALRIFAFVVPFTLYLYYFLALTLTTGVNWTIHLWLGSTVIAGVAGCMLSYVLLPPQVPADKP